VSRWTHCIRNMWGCLEYFKLCKVFRGLKTSSIPGEVELVSGAYVLTGLSEASVGRLAFSPSHIRE
jgi:hypothetical protein